MYYYATLYGLFIKTNNNKKRFLMILINVKQYISFCIVQQRVTESSFIASFYFYFYILFIFNLICSVTVHRLV